MGQAGIALEIVPGGSLARDGLAGLLGHLVANHGIGLPVAVQDGGVLQAGADSELARCGQVAAHDENAGEAPGVGSVAGVVGVALHPHEETKGAALAEAREQHAGVGQAVLGVLGAEDAADPAGRNVDAGALLVGALVEPRDVVPAGHGHAHVHRHGLGGCRG